jgi:hypothetical protein
MKFGDGHYTLAPTLKPLTTSMFEHMKIYFLSNKLFVGLTNFVVLRIRPCKLCVGRKILCGRVGCNRSARHPTFEVPE